ncbi:MAG: VWA domain-containing protein [Nitrospira sp.]|nr:VWA domain-containing protein [Nitrospira sp.]
MHFNDPWLLLFLPVVLALSIYSRTKTNHPALLFPSGKMFKGLGQTLRTRTAKSLIVVRILALLLIVIALARPQEMLEDAKIEAEGIDIVLAIDTSTSMLAEDFKLEGRRTNRLSAVKEVVKEFIGNRYSDRIGIVAFASRAYTVAPLTLDYSWLIQNLQRIETGMIEDGTAIGSGLSSALNRLKDSTAKSKVVILLTDGRNNSGRISPLTAAGAANALNIKVYTIGAGTRGLAPYPVKSAFGRTIYKNVRIDVDEEILMQVADKTNGRYFRATDTDSLREIYKEIDEMEKTDIEEEGYAVYGEIFHLFLIPGILLLIAEMILKNTVLRRLP